MASKKGPGERSSLASLGLLPGLPRALREGKRSLHSPCGSERSSGFVQSGCNESQCSLVQRGFCRHGGGGERKEKRKKNKQKK